MKTIAVHWDRSACKGWDKVLIGAKQLAMAMTGFNASGFMTITNENYTTIAQHIHARMPFHEGGKSLSLTWHIEQCRNAIGFERMYYG